jgi:hypothetical protein
MERLRWRIDFRSGFLAGALAAGPATDAGRCNLALGLMTRATLLPKHNGATLVIWGLGVGVAFR